MNDSGALFWLHTRGARWDYRWLSQSTTEPPLPGGKNRILDCVGSNATDDVPSVLAYIGNSAIVVASGRYSGRMDKYRRKIRQQIVLAVESAEMRMTPDIATLVRAAGSAELTHAASRLAADSMSLREFQHEVSQSIDEARDQIAEQPPARKRDSTPIRLLRDRRLLLCTRPGLSFGEVLSTIDELDFAISPGICVAAGVVDPVPFVGLAGVVSTAGPLLRWGVIGDQSLLFSVDGTRTVVPRGELLGYLAAPTISAERPAKESSGPRSRRLWRSARET
jgi:hypothetical protein